MGRITPRNDKNLATHMKTLDIQLLSKSRYTVMTNDYVSSKRGTADQYWTPSKAHGFMLRWLLNASYFLSKTDTHKAHPFLAHS